MIYGTPRSVDGEIRRHAVDGALDRDTPLTLVVAAAGYGKSVAVASWSRRCELDGVWVAVDEGIASRHAFWSRVLGFVDDSVVAAVASSRGFRLHDDGGPSDVRRVLTAWASSIPGPMVLVVDGIDGVEPVVMDDLHWLSAVSRHLRLILVGRSLPSGTVTLDDSIVDVRALRLTFEETAALLGRGGRRVDDLLVGDILHQTAGLPLAVAAVARALTDSRAVEAPSAASSRWIADVVERAVVGAASVQHPEDRHILERIAVIGTASIPEAVRLLEGEPATIRPVLERAVVAGYGWWDGDGDEPRFVFVPALAAALSAPLRGRRADRSLLLRAARLAGERGESLLAVTLAIDSRDIASAIALGSDDYVDLLTTRWKTLLDHVSAIPLSELSRDPFAILILAVLHAQRPRGRVAMLGYFALADRLARTGGRTAHPVERAMMLFIRSVALRLLGREKWAASAARSALAAMDAIPDDRFEALGLIGPLMVGQASLALLWSGDLRGAGEVADRAAAMHGNTDGGMEHAWSRSAFIAAVRGDVPGVTDRLEAARRHERRSDPFYRVPSAVAAAIVALERLDGDAARAHLESVADKIGSTEFWPVGMAVEAFLDLSDGRAASAIRGIETALESGERENIGPTVRAALDSLLSMAFLASGKSARARAIARRTSGGERRHPALSLLLLLAADDAAGAISFATRALQSEGASPRSQAGIRLLRATAAARRGFDRAAVRDVDIVLGDLERWGLRTPWALIPARDRQNVERIAGGIAGHDQVLADLARVPSIFCDIPEMPSLTRREREVLMGLADGRTNAEIAEMLGVSVNTVRKQRASAYRKLGVSTRDAAIAAALETGGLDP